VWKEGSVITPLSVVSRHCHRQKRVKFGDERKRKRGRRGIHFRAAHVTSRRHSSQRHTSIHRYTHVLHKSCGRATYPREERWDHMVSPITGQSCIKMPTMGLTWRQRALCAVVRVVSCRRRAEIRTFLRTDVFENRTFMRIGRF